MCFGSEGGLKAVNIYSDGVCVAVIYVLVPSHLIYIQVPPPSALTALANPWHWYSAQVPNHDFPPNLHNHCLPTLSQPLFTPSFSTPPTVTSVQYSCV
jgi:hypothetical protein